MKGHDKPYRSDVILLLASDTASMLAKEGWTRNSIREYLAEHAGIPYSEWLRQYHGAREAARHLPKSFADGKKMSDLVPKPFIEKLTIIVAGGPGEKSMVLPCWSSGRMVSSEVHFPVGQK